MGRRGDDHHHGKARETLEAADMIGGGGVEASAHGGANGPVLRDGALGFGDGGGGGGREVWFPVGGAVGADERRREEGETPRGELHGRQRGRRTKRRRGVLLPSPWTGQIGRAHV